MAISVTHTKVATTPDDPNYEVGSNEWNAAHTVTGAAEAAGTAGQVAIFDGASSLVGDAGLTYDSGTQTFALATGGTIAVGEPPNNEFLPIRAVGNAVGVALENYSGGAGVGNAPLLSMLGARGTVGSPLSVAISDGLGIIKFSGVDAGGFTQAASVTAQCSGTPSAGVIPSTITVVTTDDDGTQREFVLAKTGIFTSPVAVVTAPTVVASLPAAAAGNAGARAFVTDATAPTFGAALVGGGAVPVPCYSDGTAWMVG